MRAGLGGAETRHLESGCSWQLKRLCVFVVLPEVCCVRLKFSGESQQGRLIQELPRIGAIRFLDEYMSGSMALDHRISCVDICTELRSAVFLNHQHY